MDYKVGMRHCPIVLTGYQFFIWNDFYPEATRKPNEENVARVAIQQMDTLFQSALTQEPLCIHLHKVFFPPYLVQNQLLIVENELHLLERQSFLSADSKRLIAGLSLFPPHYAI